MPKAKVCILLGAGAGSAGAKSEQLRNVGGRRWKLTALEALNAKDYVIKKEETNVYAEAFSDSSINLLVWFWIKYPGEPNYMEVRHDAIVTIQRALNDADILIPFPIRTLDFGAKGGEKLDAMLKSSQPSSSQQRSSQSGSAEPRNTAGADAPQHGEALQTQDQF